MAVSRDDRRAARQSRVDAVFGAEQAGAVLDLFELLEMAWHDCYGELTPDETIVDDVLFCSEGKLDLLIKAAHLAVIDWRDLKMWAQTLRESRSSGSSGSLAP